MNFPRAAGILLHPTSLPGEFGIGDFGPAAFEFVDFLVESRQTYWQILPLGPTGYGDSPYQSFSAFAGNTLFISPEKLVEDGLLSEEQIATHPKFENGRTDFGGVYDWKNKILPEAFQQFEAAGDDLRQPFGTFAQANDHWLGDYALYRAIKGAQAHKPWYEWDAPLKLREPGAIAAISELLRDQILAEKFYQFLFFRQWAAVKDYAARGGVKIVGDVPIFVALDSADVWRHQDEFKLNKDGSPKVVAGVPPDYFSKTGQLWGNPIYDWDEMREDGFRWWIDRVKHTLTTVDIVRIDHFVGFAAAWEVPGGDETAEHGSWADVPGEELFAVLKNELGELPFWAEDLGHVTPRVEHLRDSFGLPGMRILQFAFGGDAKNQNLPHNYIRNSVAYTGTHDNDTAVGWWRTRLDAGESASREREFCLRYLMSDGAEINWDLIRALWSSVADTAIVPLQDALGLDNEARMNVPASSTGNWQWRFRDENLTAETRSRLRSLTETYGREPAPPGDD